MTVSVEGLHGWVFTGVAKRISGVGETVAVPGICTAGGWFDVDPSGWGWVGPGISPAEPQAHNKTIRREQWHRLGRMAKLYPLSSPAPSNLNMDKK
jgi:hypothetical protein